MSKQEPTDASAVMLSALRRIRDTYFAQFPQRAPEHWRLYFTPESDLGVVMRAIEAGEATANAR